MKKVILGFITQLDKQGINLTVEQQANYINDSKIYCEEMVYKTEDEINDGALEYITSQIHYGILR